MPFLWPWNTSRTELEEYIELSFLPRWIPVKCNLHPCCFVCNGFPRGLFGKKARLFVVLKADFQFERRLNETWGKHFQTGCSPDIKEIPFKQFTFLPILIFLLREVCLRDYCYFYKSFYCFSLRFNRWSCYGLCDAVHQKDIVKPNHIFSYLFAVSN